MLNTIIWRPMKLHSHWLSYGDVSNANMASPAALNLSSMYGELNKFCQNGDYERAVKSANKGKNFIK